MAMQESAGVSPGRARRKDATARAGAADPRPLAEVDESICSFLVRGETYALESQHVLAVLGDSVVHAVPMAPRFLAGALSHRGEVLTVVCPRRLMGVQDTKEERPVLVVRDPATAELYGIAVDAIRAVVQVSRESFQANPCTLDGAQAELFAGSYRVDGGLVIMLDPESFSPRAASERMVRTAGGDACAPS